MTSEPRTELRAESGQAWLQDERVPGAKKPAWSTQAATGATVIAILDPHKT